MLKRGGDVSPLRMNLAISLALLLSASFLGIHFKRNNSRITSLYVTRALDDMRHDRFDEAIEALNKALDAEPGNQQAATELSKARIFRVAIEYDILNRAKEPKELNELAGELDRLLNKQPQNAELIALRGILYALSDQPKAAIDHYRKALELSPKYANALNYWGYTAYQWQYPEENWQSVAEDQFRAAIASDSSYVMPYLNLAVLLLDQEKPEVAVGILGEVEGGAKDNVRFHLIRGGCFLSWAKALEAAKTDPTPDDKLTPARKYLEALHEYRIVSELNPRVPDLHLNMGVALQALGQVDEAISEYRFATMLEPDLPDAYENLAFLLYQKGDYQTAVKYIDESLPIVRQLVNQFKTRADRTRDEAARQRLRRLAEKYTSQQIWLESGATELRRLSAPTRN